MAGLATRAPGRAQPVAPSSSAYSTRQYIGLGLGPALFLLFILLPAPAGLSSEAMMVAATTLWIAVWWITEPIPLAATSLLPIVLLPATGALTAAEATAGYANPLIFVFLGGFMIALALEAWGLHRRIALFIISVVGCSPTRMVLGFMAATGFLSMWISNTATAMMMLPIGMAVIAKMADLIAKNHSAEEAERADHNFGTALMLGIAYAASIGGVGTLIGTPPNVVMAASVQELLGIEISFAQWMVVGAPLAVFGVIGAWLYLTRFAYPVSNEDLEGGMDVIRDEQRGLGRMSRGELSVLIIFVLVAFAWISRQWLIKPIAPNVNDGVIAIAGAILLFCVPTSLSTGKFVLDWDTAKKLPWGIMLLFGGGLSIAGAFKATGLSLWLGEVMSGLYGLPTLLVLLVVVGTVTFMTEVTSNTASATLLMPVMAALAVGLMLDPLLLMIPVALAASCAFMMPVATPPNAIVFGSGRVTIMQMARTGFWVNLGAILIITAVAYWIVPLVWGIAL